MEDLDSVFESDLSEVDKLAQAFDLITRPWIEQARNEIDLCRALQDRDALVKQQIKLGVTENSRRIFSHCFQRSTGRKAWNE